MEVAERGSAFQRNPITTALGSLLALALAILLALNAQTLPVIGDGSTHHAEFAESSGLAAGADVRVAGVRVGRVTEVQLQGDHVDVSFTTGDQEIGDRTSAAIKLGSLLGQKYLALDPRGAHPLDGTIPRHRTTSLYDVMAAFQDLSGAVGQVNTDQLAQSFTVLSDTMRGTPEETRGAVRGLSRLSTSIASRDQQLKELLQRTNDVSHLMHSRDQQFQQLLADGNAVLEQLNQRRAAIHSLLAGTQALSGQLTAMTSENEAQVKPALESLNQVSAMLSRNQQNIEASVHKLAPFYRTLDNTMGNGRWIDVYVCGLLPPAVGPVNQQGCKL